MALLSTLQKNMIAFFNGPPGVGKTYHGTAYALYCLDRQLRVAVSWNMTPPEGVRLVDLRPRDDAGNERRPDMTIEAANDVEGPVLFRFSELVEIFGLRRVQVFKDEAQNDLGSRDWEKMPLRVRIWMSEHRHYMTNLYLYTQHYKFVDIYPRRLGLGNVHTITRFLNLTLEIPRPEADSETGELGPPAIFDTKAVPRPWRGLDMYVPDPGFFDLWGLGKRVPAHYSTHAPHEKDIRRDDERKKPSRSAPAAPAASRTAELPFS